MGKIKEFRPLQIMCHNGWEWHHYNTDWLIQIDNSEDYSQYTLDVMGWGFNSTVRATVCSCEKHLEYHSTYGVLWLDIAKYECDNAPHSPSDLREMQLAIEHAENNLLTIGMPFVPDYKFNGKNKANKKRRNDSLRKQYGLDEKGKT